MVLAAECMDLLDGMIVNVAAPAISRDLGASSTGLQWMVGGYALTFAIGLITGARLGDIYGRRRLFLIGVAGFTASSVLCGLAPTTGTLIAARLVQGLFAALLIPQGFGIIRQVFPPDEIGKAFGLFGPVIGLSAVLGPVLGGALVDLDISAPAGARSSSSTCRSASRRWWAPPACSPSRAPSGRPRSTSSAPRWSASAPGC